LRLYDEGITAPSLLFWRYGIALAAILIAARLARHGFYRAGVRGGFRITLIGGTLGAVQTLCFFESLRFLETGIAILLFYTTRR
jgi:drug/metabolite transporter (DMT)-like permease